MVAKRSEGLLIEAQPLRVAEGICRTLIGGVRIADGALFLAADPAWAGAINTVLVKKGVTVKELRRVDKTLPSDTQAVSTVAWRHPTRTDTVDAPIVAMCHHLLIDEG